MRGEDVSEAVDPQTFLPHSVVARENPGSQGTRQLILRSLADCNGVSFLLFFQTLSEQAISTVNISHLGSEADVQLAEALVAVSEAVVAAAAEVDDTPRVVAVEETTHSDDAVMQQVCFVTIPVGPTIVCT